MREKVALFTGSFDPVTLGHINLIERASKMFDRLIVGIFYNPHKQGFLPLDTRERLLKESLSSLTNVEVVVSTGELVVEVARQYGVTTLVRGLRGGEDLAYEASFDFYNRGLAPELETIYLLAQSNYRYISSSGVRELYAFKADTSAYVPDVVVKELERKRENEKNEPTN